MRFDLPDQIKDVVKHFTRSNNPNQLNVPLLERDGLITNDFIAFFVMLAIYCFKYSRSSVFDSIIPSIACITSYLLFAQTPLGRRNFVDNFRRAPNTTDQHFSFSSAETQESNVISINIRG